MVGEDDLSLFPFRNLLYAPSQIFFGGVPPGEDGIRGFSSNSVGVRLPPLCVVLATSKEVTAFKVCGVVIIDGGRCDEFIVDVGVDDVAIVEDRGRSCCSLILASTCFGRFKKLFKRPFPFPLPLLLLLPESCLVRFD
jgi:hypothetical protein